VSGSGSVSFDRAASYYDRTRSLPDDAMAQLVGFAAAELAGRGPTLEIGVGTGRIALALEAAGASIVGVDLSSAMLARLVRNAGGRAPFPIALADATKLPFPDGTFGSGLAVHVLHLIPSWEQAIDELLRTVRSKGVILIDPGGWTGDWLTEFHERFCKAAGVPIFPGLVEPEDLDRAMAERGAPGRRLPPVTERQTFTMVHHLRMLEEGMFSYTWSVPEPDRRRIVAGIRAWAQDRYGDLEEPRPSVRDIIWRVFEVP
jgi:ubiquinone/menaquinone biosynthesis C-methylase UbiE